MNQDFAAPVVLVQMPFATVDLPSLALGLLQSRLQDEGIPCRVWYPNLDFAMRVGVEHYRPLTIKTNRMPLAGEWTFAASLFPDGGISSVDAYIDALASADPEFPQELATSLRRAHAEVPPFLEHSLTAIDWRAVRVVGFASSLFQQTAALSLAQRLKSAFPHLTIVMGGANCEGTSGYHLLRLFPFLDAVFHGEAEATLPRFVSALLAGESWPEMPGVSFRRGSQLVRGDAAPVPITELDELPYPSYDDFFAQLDTLPATVQPRTEVFIEMSRGCWWGAKHHCIFCGLNGLTMGYRLKSPGRVLAELDYLRDCYAPKEIHVTDNILAMPYFKNLLPVLAARPAEEKSALFFEVKANLTREQLSLLRRAGVTGIQPGIESLDAEILRIMRKGVSMLQNVQTLKWARENGLVVLWNLIYGFPGEPIQAYAHMAEVIPSLHHLMPAADSGRARMDRFSPLFDERETFGLTNVRPIPEYLQIYPFDVAEVAEVAYYFAFDYDDGRNPTDYVQEALRAWREWRDLWTDRHQAGVLVTCADEEGGLDIYDTRRRAQCRHCRLSPTQAALYRYLDQIRSADQVISLMAEIAPDLARADVLAQMDDWTARGWVLQDGSHYLALGLSLERWNRERYGQELALLFALTNPIALDGYGAMFDVL